MITCCAHSIIACSRHILAGAVAGTHPIRGAPRM